jgi:hypothetical protein
MNLQTTHHLNHEQLCDVLLGSNSQCNDDSSAILVAHYEASQEHLRECLICASELDLMRSSVVGFHAASIAVAERELAQRPLRTPFAPIYSEHSRRYATPVFFWATAALVFAALIPLGLLNPKLSPLHKPQIISTQPVSTSDSQPDSDAALLDGIDEDLSAAVPTPMQPLAGPSAETPAEPTSSDVQNQDQRIN